MKIKKAKKKDLNYIKRLLRNNNLPAGDLDSKVDSLFIGYLNSERVGIGGLEIYGNYGLLHSLVIVEPFRRKGYGKELIFQIMEYAKLKGVKEIYLLTTAAEKFFKKFGFKKINRQMVPKTIQNTSEFKQLCPASAVCMMKRISQ